MTERGRYSPLRRNPTFTSMRIGKWRFRLANAADVSTGRVRTVDDLVTDHDDDGINDANEKDV